ncbi:TonB-dependent siderophore receptor [Comamonas antarctica]|uniref:TonB-dependent siderophore receptor n=1 Tax=Comamonas antarctica TaxID=2743470 RepID=UPI0028E40409|nr:TonB-dependent siderophore receptor [Comamonas antarctica]
MPKFSRAGRPLRIAALSMLCASAWAAPLAIDLPAQPLGDALKSLARSAGVTIAADGALLAGRQAPAVRGQLELSDGLRQLLRGSGLEFVQSAPGTYLIRATQLDTVTVRAQAMSDGTTEGTGSYTQTGSSRTSTGLNLTLRETPQSVSVMTRQRMDDFKLETLTDVMEQTPGVTIDRQGDGNNILVRGDNVNLQVDGMRQMASGWYANTQTLYTMDDMVEMDRIEVLKGSSGLVSGDGKYGGTVNMIRKRPTQEFKASVGAGVGSWDSYRADVDIGGALNASGSIRGRIVAAAADGKDFRDHAKRSNQTLFGTLDIDLSDRTLLNVGFTQRHREYYGAGSTSMIQAYAATGQSLGLQPRSFNVGAPWSGYEQDSRTLFASLEHRFGNGWSARLRASDEKTEQPYGETGIWFTGIPSVVDIGWARDHVNDNTSVALDLQGPVQLFGRTHELLLRADTMRTSSDTYSGSQRINNAPYDYAAGGAAIVRPAGLESIAMNNHSYFSSRRHSAYAAGNFSLADPVKLIAGARITSYQQYDLTPYAYSNFDIKRSDVVTPYAGLVVDVSENISLYGSYASIFKPQSAMDAQGRSLDPEEGQTREIGAKGEFLDKRLNASLAYFWMKTDNVAEATGQVTPDGISIYRSVSGVTRRGYELELSGELARGWQAQGSYVQNSSNLDSTRYLPKNQFKLGTTYALGASGLTLGAATRWQSQTTAGALVQPSFWVVDLMARYRINRQLSVSLNVRNAFDKSYFSGMRDFGRVQYTWGAPRSASVNMRYEF